VDEDVPFRIVVNYRREESAGHTGHLYDDLSEHYGEDHVFMDIGAIKPGEDFAEVIEEAVGSCDAFLAVIGRTWAAATNARGDRRLDNPADYVRLEIEAALTRHVRLIPILVQGSEMPTVDDLPKSMEKLAGKQAHEISDKRWRTDVATLIEVLDELAREKRAALAEEQRVALETAAAKQAAERGELQPAIDEPRHRGRGWAFPRRGWVILGVGALAALALAVALPVVVGRGDGSADEWSQLDSAADELDGPGPQVIYDVTTDGLRAIAVGKSGRRAAVWTQTATGWSREELPGSAGMQAIAASGRTLVSVGSVESGGADGVNGMIWRLSGGDWVRTCPPSVCGGPEKQEILGVAAISDGRFVAVGRVIVTDATGEHFDAAVWLSDDGKSWRRAAGADDDLRGDRNQVMRDVADVDGRLVAVGRSRLDGVVWTSDEDGSDWTIVTDPAFRPETDNIELAAVATLAARVIAVGRETNQDDVDEAAAWFSDDGGSHWTRATVPNAHFVEQQMVDVVAAPPGLIAVGNDESQAAVWQSPDGSEWTALTSSSFDGRSGMLGVAPPLRGTLYSVGTGLSDGRIWFSDSRTSSSP
jgi:hypothetical protein